MRTSSIAAFIGLFASLGLGLGCSSGDDAEETTEAAQASSATDGAGASAASLIRGVTSFFNEVPGVQGNGRKCATCHVAGDAFQLTPAHVEQRWQALVRLQTFWPGADDPLFRSTDADDGARDFTTLRKFALVRVELQLPTDAEGRTLIFPTDNPTARTVSVWRSTPSVRNVAFTAPYQQDGRFATLQEQASGALFAHAEIQHAPNPRVLDDISAFEKVLFSSASVAKLSASLAAGTIPADPDPVLNPLEQAGKQIFKGACAGCHGGPTQTRPDPRFGPQDVFVSRPLPPFAAGLRFVEAPPLAVRLWAVRVPGAPAPVVRPSTDPGRALVTGKIADFNTFDTPSLYGIAQTAPYFHDNSAKTLEEVILQYQSLFEALNRVLPPGQAPQRLPDSAVAPLVAYLKKI